MKKLLLLFAVTISCSASILAQQNSENSASNFQFNWTEYLLPDCSFLIHQGENECYFIDSLGNPVPKHTYLSITTGGKDHFIVQDRSGFHLLDTKLERVTDKPYDSIKRTNSTELELSSEDNTIYYSWNSKKKSYAFTDISGPPDQSLAASVIISNLKLGDVTDSRFKAKRIEQLRLGIDMTKTLTVGQKGKNVLVFKGDKIVFKGPEKPMLYCDFMITGEKGPHSIYHPISKDPILEDCDRFWCVGSFLVVSVKGSLRKHIVSNTGEIILSSAGEIRYYDYEFGGIQYSFFCDGRSVINLNGDVIYRSDGELIGVAEHYIYAGNSGAYLGNLSSEVEMSCTNFERYGILTVGQTGRNEWRLFDPKSILINSCENYFIDEMDSVLITTQGSKTMVFDAFTGEMKNMYATGVRAQKHQNSDTWNYYAVKKDANDQILKGRFDPKDGIMIEPKYRNIAWPANEKYYIVLTEKGLVRYLNSKGQELFD